MRHTNQLLLPDIVLSKDDLGLNFEASFRETIDRFKIDVDEGFLSNTKLKASLTRFVEDISQPDFTDGPPRSMVEKTATFWANEYDWREVEAKINRDLQQYTTIVCPPGEIFPHPVPLHFVHHRSQRESAIPLLFIHGWPGSFLEVESIIAPLTNPRNDDMPAFHVVAPSVPGYGFSPSPGRPGMGYRAVAHVFNALMQKLGYVKYVYQGGDAGDFIGHFAALDFPSAVVSGHSNFWISPPTAADLERSANGQTSREEDSIIERLSNFTTEHWSYGVIQQTQPLKLAIGMTDSPVGLAMWIYDIARTGFEDPDFLSLHQIVTWTMMHWINGPYAAFSLYKNGRKVRLNSGRFTRISIGCANIDQDGIVSIQGINSMPYISQPIALSQFPYDIWYGTPLEWARRSGNVVQMKKHSRGGHFAAVDVPDLLVDDIRAFFGDEDLSGTRLFLSGSVVSQREDANLYG
jgi:pimeloyl-ACP methyl ester carboxylesterase